MRHALREKEHEANKLRREKAELATQTELERKKFQSISFDVKSMLMTVGKLRESLSIAEERASLGMLFISNGSTEVFVVEKDKDRVLMEFKCCQEKLEDSMRVRKELESAIQLKDTRILEGMLFENPRDRAD